ncbi:hypothetical protein ACMD2_12970 [Ananas comosus]|uniref:Neprosin PEP catalytic domain-containing protein n=1 Tax=Ananas comosus TaxID=4615 RepID=A0A199UP88_ANACO|nr:hypothetical protein ACMD2_12970 [Ananas comosus]
MGSGHYANELERKAAFMKNLEIFDEKGESHPLVDGRQFAKINKPTYLSEKRKNTYDISPTTCCRSNATQALLKSTRQAFFSTKIPRD